MEFKGEQVIIKAKAKGVKEDSVIKVINFLERGDVTNKVQVNV